MTLSSASSIVEMASVFWKVASSCQIDCEWVSKTTTTLKADCEKTPKARLASDLLASAQERLRCDAMALVFAKIFALPNDHLIPPLVPLPFLHPSVHTVDMLLLQATFRPGPASKLVSQDFGMEGRLACQVAEPKASTRMAFSSTFLGIFPPQIGPGLSSDTKSHSPRF